MPIFIAAFIAAVLANVAQVGFQISTHPLKFDWNKIKFDPATIFKKVFFSKQIGMNLFKSIFKVTAIGLIAYLIIKNDYELILLDTPPTLTVTDAAIIGRSVEGIIMVIRAGKIGKREIMRTKEIIQRLKGNIIGTVLNGVDVSSQYYSYYEKY